MILFKELYERLSGVHALNQKLDIVIKQTDGILDLLVNHEHRITRLETVNELKSKINSIE